MSKENKIKNKKMLIFGGTGSLGKALIQRFLKDNKICVYSRDESKHWTLKNEIDDNNLTCFIGDIRDKQRCLESLLAFQPTHVIIASALKHVDVCEKSPYESILTNVDGVANVVKAINENSSSLDSLETVLMVSTDKACSPINVYGMCKAIAERMVTSCAALNSKIKFVAVRYGNVLESRGSIIPLFKYQSENKESITVTNDKMTRYVMTLNESVDLIEETMINGKSGETWIPSLLSMKIIDLAEIFSEMRGKPIKIVGMRPGEKIHESLINESESLRAKVGEKYTVVLPSYTQPFNKKTFSMKSDTSVMSKEELRVHLESLGIFQKPLSQFIGKKIEDIRKS